MYFLIGYLGVIYFLILITQTISSCDATKFKKNYIILFIYIHSCKKSLNINASI